MFRKKNTNVERGAKKDTPGRGTVVGKVCWEPYAQPDCLWNVEGGNGDRELTVLGVKLALALKGGP